jgi:predicted ribosomally synthesized peptide with SipW-like signal peptide
MGSTDVEGRARPAGRASVARVGGVVGSLALVSWLVVTGSSAVFTDATDSTGNSFTAGDIDLVDDDAGSALFTVSDMEPGQSVSDCIEVTYQGSIPDPSGVVVYSGGFADSGTFGTFLNLTVEEGTGGSFGDCTGFVPDGAPIASDTLTGFDGTFVDYASGAGTWDPAGTPESKAYRITVQLDPAADDTQQGASVSGLTLTWEIQS